MSAADAVRNVKKVRLNADLAPDVAAALQRLAERNGISLSEAVRRAISTESYLQQTRDSGGKVLIEGGDGRLKELVFLDGPKIISGSDCAEWNKQIRRAFARTLLAAHSAEAKGALPATATTTIEVLKVLTDLRRKLAALPHRQIELALGEYEAWMLKGDAFDLIDAEIERIDRAKGE